MSFAFSDAQTKLSQLLGDANTSTDDAWPLAVRKKELNRGELRFAVDSKMIRENATGTVASMELSFPSDLLEIWVMYITVSSVKYKITSDREVSVKDLERWNNYDSNYPYYYIWEYSGTRKIKLLGSSGSINGSSYDLYYIKRPTTELSADGDTSLLPEEFREGPVYYAASQLLKQTGRTEMAALYQKEYLEILGRARRYIENRDVTYDFPRPDFGVSVGYTTDHQGGGMPV